MRLLKRFANALIAAGERAGRRKAHEVLRAMTSQQQLELGYSPALLRQGVDAWPWNEKPGANSAKASATEQTRVTEAELTAFSNGDLSKLGFDGGDVPRAFRYGHKRSKAKAA